MKEYIGELIGTFILVFIGCGSVGLAILFGTFSSLLEVAIVWGIGVAAAIYITRGVCPAHLNPAVSIAMTLAGNLSSRKLPMYILFQFVGAFLAGGLLYFFLQNPIDNYESAHGILRGSNESINTAMMFGEFFPNPGYQASIKLTWVAAMLWEGLGTFILVFVIFLLSGREGRINFFIPLLIGATITGIICLVAPYTQAGLNPARDFGPRMIAYFAGWDSAAFPEPPYGFFTVYILGPILGGIAAFGSYRYFWK